MGLYHYRHDLYATLASTATNSETAWIGDAEVLSLQQLGSASTTTLQVQVSNDDGRGSAITTWSNWTILTGLIPVASTPSALTIGARWLRTIRLTESTTVVLTQRVRT